MEENNNNGNNNTENITETESSISDNKAAAAIESIETGSIDEIPESAENTEAAEIVETVELAPDNIENIPELKPPKKSGEAFKKFKESIIGITVILGIISVGMAFVLALLNSITAPVIAKRLADEKQEIFAELFGDGAEAEILENFEDIYLNSDATIAEVALVNDKSSQKFAGYCVTVEPKGFGGKIIMLVAVNPDITVKGTKIVSMSETAGQGTKISSEDWFGEQFKYKKRDIKSSKNEVSAGDNAIQTIAGATVSSKAFLNGVNSALAVADEIHRKMSGTTDPEEISDELGELDEINEFDEAENAEREDNPDE
ncbi:MAG: FMN-binding protein [Oscillospiraceae bacterium]|nr:FMN-binding protein [Oscillospiraceae bacterium]